jgi:dTDP-glucose 4,6-dehydratase
MRILVTGGAGFIGSNFIRYFLKKYPHYQIANLDKLTYAGNLKNLHDIKNNRHYCFIKGDICDRKKVDKLMANVDAVINFAAESHVDRSIKDAADFLKTNFYGTAVLLESARQRKIKKFVQISTDEVYGSIAKGAFREGAQLSPSSPYAATKAAADLFCQAYFVTYNFPVVIVRSTNNFGPYQYPEKVIPLFITNALENKKLPVYGKGLNYRDWLYVGDNCAGIDLVFHKGAAGEIYNIGAGNQRRNIELAKLILELLHKPKSLISYVPDRLGHDWRYSLHFSKIKKLGFSPNNKFKEMLKTTVEWYQKNRQWWMPLKNCQ